MLRAAEFTVLVVPFAEAIVAKMVRGGDAVGEPTMVSRTGGREAMDSRLFDLPLLIGKGAVTDGLEGGVVVDSLGD